MNFIPKNISKTLVFIILITLSLIKSTYSICNVINCPPLRGFCQGNKCVCENNYITVNNNIIHNQGIFCNYAKKSKLVAFMLEFFFPFGVGHFYSGKTLLAAIKLCLFLFLMCMCYCLLACVFGKVITAYSILICFVVIVCIISLIVLQIYDLFSYAFGFYSDGNDVVMR